ncbi:Arf-GAP with Rho-GAP domain, ANK repeat and PH domain-containing protein 2 [Acromyrmex echinatior]|uniref:Arf-GAP with Rho-GAP domain, ANK repeat and PH domain-containing protein 2 n=1 Tax=Acromyrmex echinatior TaxID=103372 RepID=F4WY92_ACREC|nr:Arf-GAP with Rho-GAP domain, ANK repeat and PH domain-containing protein 2 [Acromyrmex echinatior]
MEVKPIPKPRSVITESRPIPAPRRLLPMTTLPSTHSSSPTSESSQSEKSDDLRSTSSTSENSRGNHEFFRSLSTSSRQLKDEISEKMTVKGRAVISSTRNASIRLEKSVKNLLTRRLSSLNQDDVVCQSGVQKKLKDPVEEDRCVSMPADNIFSSISFYSPLSGNLRSVKNEEDLSTGGRHSPPPPVYPPPPLPDESIYDELQSVTSGSSDRYDTLSSTVSDKIERDFHDFNVLGFSRNQASDSDQSLNLSDVNASLSLDKSETSTKRLSRSDSWTFYDVTPGTKSENVDEVDRIFNVEEESLEKSFERKISPVDRTSCASFESQASIQNSLYENLSPPKADCRQELTTSPSDTRVQSSKSVLFEFDPFAKTSEDENVYSNYENNDLMLLETLLATNDLPSSADSTLEFRESAEEEQEDEELIHSGITPPEPPKRFDSLPKNEYDVAEGVEQPDKVQASSKNPPLLPKLAHLVTKKQPAVPPRKPPRSSMKGPPLPQPNANMTVTTTTLANNDEENVTNSSSATPRLAEDNRKVSVIQKLKKLRQESTVHAIKPNVISFVKSGSKLLARTREHIGESGSRSLRMERPKVNVPHNPVTHRGIVYRTGMGIERAKDLVPRAAVLLDRKLSFYADKSMSTLKEVVELETVHSIHLLQDVNLRQSYFKEGVTGTWFPAWLLLQQRILTYTKTSESAVNYAVNFEHVDLRKARCIVLRDQEGPIAACGTVPIVVVDAGGSGALHIATSGTHESTAWRHALYQAATNCGPALDQQQITQDNVPVILDKCINFIYAHGMMTEGIYRRSGSSSAVVKLLEAFRRDAWATQITRNVYSEHDVATVLRRFLRDLPESLFPPNIHDRLCLASESTSEENRIATYRKLLSTLNPITSATLRRILAHLHGLSQQSARNLMTVENLSAVWGPTLMHAGENSAEEWNRTEIKVIGDLIKLYPKLYQLSSADLAKEAKMLEILEKHHVSNNGLRGAPSGDLKIWIYILSPNGECVNVTIGPQKTAFDVCRELAEKTNLPSHELCLEEYTLSGALERPLHHNERVLEAVARWGYWDSDDRKDNVLILRKDRLYKDIVPLVKPPMTISGELKFADIKTKNLKTYLFEFSQAKLFCYKDKVCSVKLHEWKIEDIIWYLGHEPKRNPQMGWSLTFITKNKKPTRCKDSPYFGNILAGTSKDEQYKWLAAMLFGEYQLNLRASAVNLMDP